MITHRTLVVLLIVMSTAGCTGLPGVGDTGSRSGGDLQFEAGNTTVEQPAVSEAGYELEQSSRNEFEETVEVAGEEQEIVVSQHQAVYQKANSGAPGASQAFVTVVTTPKINVAGQEFNPLLRMDEADRLEQVSDQEDVDLDTETTYTINLVSKDPTVTVYSVTNADASEPQAFVHALRVSPPDSDDVILAYALYPTDIHDQEQSAIRRLYRGLAYSSTDDN